MLADDALWFDGTGAKETVSPNCHKPLDRCFCWKTGGGGPGGMEDASLLDVGAESDSNLVEIATEDGAVPDGRSVVDGDLTG